MIKVDGQKPGEDIETKHVNPMLTLIFIISDTLFIPMSTDDKRRKILTSEHVFKSFVCSFNDQFGFSFFEDLRE